eukprot:3019818-Rhodomonas_salina.2
MKTPSESWNLLSAVLAPVLRAPSCAERSRRAWDRPRGARPPLEYANYTHVPANAPAHAPQRLRHHHHIAAEMHRPPSHRAFIMMCGSGGALLATCSSHTPASGTVSYRTCLPCPRHTHTPAKHTHSLTHLSPSIPLPTPSPESPCNISISFA